MKFSAISLFIVLLFFGKEGSNSLQDNGSRISKNTEKVYSFSANGRYAAWSSKTQNKYKVTVYNTIEKTTQVLAEELINNPKPIVFNDLVIWEIHTGKGQGLVFYHIGKSKPVEIILGGFNLSSAKTSGQRIACHATIGQSHYILIYKPGESKASRIKLQMFAQPAFDINENYLVWSDKREKGNEIFLMDFKTGKVFRLTNRKSNDFNPVLSGDYAVWLTDDGHDSEIVVYDIKQNIQLQLTANNYNDYQPVMGRKQIAWLGNEGTETEVFLYDMQTGETVQKTNNHFMEYNLAINDGFLAWATDSPPSSRISWYEIKTEELTEMQDFELQSPTFQLVDNGFVWRSNEGSDQSAYFYHFNELQE